MRLKREIVTMGQPDVDPKARVGHYVEPADWNDLIRSPDVAVIDTRNDYEVAIGTFEGAVDPQTESFRDFPQWWEENKARFHNKRIAMFCTGGIRCERATALLDQLEKASSAEGGDFKTEGVVMVRGGIERYVKTFPEGGFWKVRRPRNWNPNPKPEPQPNPDPAPNPDPSLSRHPSH